MDAGYRRLPRQICLGALLLAFAGCESAPRAEYGDETACYEALTKVGVRFERVPEARALGVEWPIKLSGPIRGVRVYGGKEDAPTSYLDCRLALALVDWAPILKRQGVIGLQHYSMYRQDARIGKSTKTSGHALGRAIDVGYFDLADGRRLSVLDHWKNRARGVEPCEVRSKSREERLMRALVCAATEHDLFQMVLTPHYNEAHENHVHLEVGAPDADAWIG